MLGDRRQDLNFDTFQQFSRGLGPYQTYSNEKYPSAEYRIDEETRSAIYVEEGKNLTEEVKKCAEKIFNRIKEADRGGQTTCSFIMFNYHACYFDSNLKDPFAHIGSPYYLTNCGFIRNLHLFFKNLKISMTHLPYQKETQTAQRIYNQVVIDWSKLREPIDITEWPTLCEPAA